MKKKGTKEKKCKMSMRKIYINEKRVLKVFPKLPKVIHHNGGFP
jgi:hypothetical protein